MTKLLVISSNSIHTFNFIDLVTSHFDEILLLTNNKNLEHEVSQETADFHFSPRSLLSTPRKIREIVNNFKPTHIHVHQANSYAFYTALALGKRKNMVLTAWGSDIFILPKRNLFWKKIVQFSVNRFSFLTADSQHLADEMQKLCQSNDSKITVVNFGIDLQPVRCDKEPIFYSNRLHKPLYRIDKVIEGFHKFITNNEDQRWKLVIGATGDQTENIKEQVIALGLSDRVEFVGWVNSEINRAWYARSTYWLSVPTSDATSISLLEAMAYGCVPILSDLPSNKEWVESGVNGLIISELELAGNFLPKINSVDVKKAIVINKEIIEQRGTKEANRQKFIDIYQQISG